MTLQRPASEPSPEDAPVGATAAPTPPGQSRSRGFSPRHWKVRSKLAAVLLVPAIAFLVLASINMAGQIGSARDFGRGANVAEFGRQASSLVHELQAERDIAAGYVAAGREPSNQAAIDKANATNVENAKAKPPKPAVPVPPPNYGATLATQQQNVDGALTAYRTADAALGDVGDQAQSRVDAARIQLDGLPSLRAALNRSLLTEGAINGKYSAMISSLLDINREIGQGAGNTQLNNQVAGLTALGDLKETLSQERCLV